MSILITGGTGFLGAELCRLLVADGHRPILLDPAPPRGRLLELAPHYHHVPASLTNLPVLLNTVREHGVRTVYHLGGMLSMPSERDPWGAFEINVAGTYHVLEACRLEGVERCVFASSIAVYAEGLTGDTITDDSLQRPTSMYGAGKVFSELQGRFYARRFGLDFRGLRVPSVVGPGSRVAHMSIYNCWAIEHPLAGRAYRIPVEPETRCPTLYYKDAARAFWLLGRAKADQIKTKVYNVAGQRPAYTAAQLADAVRAQVPGADLDFAPDPGISQLLQGIGHPDLDDSPARREWGWEPAFELEAMVADFAAEYRAHPELYAF